jgi:tetratricopeptide (TPR) repeat protein
VTFRFTCAFAALLLATSALAGHTEEAREHYEKATAHFAVGEFADAAVEYQAAYKAKPDPALLYDAAQAYRLANNPEKALILYRNYLQLYPNEPNIGEVRAQIEKLKDAIAAADKAKTAPPTGTNEPTRITPDPTEATKPALPPQPTTALTTESSTKTDHDQRPTPIYKKWWLWTAVGAVVAGGVVVAVVLSTQTHGTWANAPDVGPGSRNGLTIATVRW